MDRPTIDSTDDPLAFSGAKRLPEENKSKVILVVDDDPDMIAVVASIGRKAGYTVFGASSGEECLSMLWRVTPELIMLDVKMAGLDGFETCRRVRSDPNVAHVPIAFLTARKTVDDVKRGVAAGVDDFIVKPFDSIQLVERIELLISRGHLLGVERTRRSSKVGSPKRGEDESSAVTVTPVFKDRTIRMVSGPNSGASAVEIQLESKIGAREIGGIATRAERCSLRQIAALPLAPFLVHEGHHKAPGLISIAVLPLWWDALMAIAVDQLNPIQRDLDRLLPLDDVIGLVALSQTLRGVIATLTNRLSALLRDPKPSHAPAVKALTRVGAGPEIKLISEILLVAGPLEEAIETFDRGLPREAKVKSPIAELSPPLVNDAKKCYTKLGEGGVAGQLFVIAILNRLEKPWQIFRLARALSWNRDASVVSGTELGVIGDRLFLTLDNIAGAVETAMAKIRSTAVPIDYDEMQSLVARYTDTGEGILTEIDIKRDSPWGEALIRARVKMCEALKEEHLSRLADTILIPVPEQPDANWALAGALCDDDSVARQSELTIANAGHAIRLLTYVAQRGDKHGFGSPARRVLESVREKVADRIGMALNTLRVNPTKCATPAYLEQAIKLVEILFKDQRGQTLGKQLKAVLESR